MPLDYSKEQSIISSKITLDVMICGDETINTTATIDKSAYGNFMREKDIHDYYVNYDSIY